MLLIGNSFPLSLIRRRVTIEPVPLETLREAIVSAGGVLSFWGHVNTLAVAEAALGHSVEPASERPALRLSPDNLPLFEGRIFAQCWILSPDYTENFRPKVGEEVPTEKIKSWQVLRMRWENLNKVSP
jgi:hypothetical protein